MNEYYEDSTIPYTVFGIWFDSGVMRTDAVMIEDDDDYVPIGADEWATLDPFYSEV